ncbi:MAG: hypothetical protein M3O70_07890 [Actinomycetota bacterium]|nr:hypothetical protein [Actinomycetota bacterium]
MVKKSVVLLIALLASLATVGSAVAQQERRPESGQSGGFSLTVHSHSSEFGGGPGGAPLLRPDTEPLPFPITEGGFSYSSVACDDPARFNDVALNFNPDYPGIEDPASVRHIVEGTATEVDKPDMTGTVEGTITTFLCEGGQEGDEIHIAYEGRFRQVSDNEARLTGTTFEIIGGTGRFADLEGQGSMTGSFTCLPGVLERAGAASCAELGAFSDAVFRLRGNYQDPTA